MLDQSRELGLEMSIASIWECNTGVVYTGRVIDSTLVWYSTGDLFVVVLSASEA